MRGTITITDQELEARRLHLILDQVRESLRVECALFDANDWPDDLHPADVIEKHLARAAHARVAELEQRVRELEASQSH